MTPTELNRQLYNDAYKDCVAAIRSSSDNYDRNLITISSAFIAVPFALIRQAGGNKPLVGPINLYLAEGAFLLTILLVLLSFQLSAKVNRVRIFVLKSYYLDQDDKALTKETKWSSCLTVVNAGSGLTFFIAVILTAVFVYRNLGRFQ